MGGTFGGSGKSRFFAPPARLFLPLNSGVAVAASGGHVLAAQEASRPQPPASGFTHGLFNRWVRTGVGRGARSHHLSFLVSESNTDLLSLLVQKENTSGSKMSITGSISRTVVPKASAAVCFFSGTSRAPRLERRAWPPLGWL